MEVEAAEAELWLLWDEADPSRCYSPCGSAFPLTNPGDGHPSGKRQARVSQSAAPVINVRQGALGDLSSRGTEQFNLVYPCSWRREMFPALRSMSEMRTGNENIHIHFHRPEDNHVMDHANDASRITYSICDASRVTCSICRHQER